MDQLSFIMILKAAKKPIENLMRKSDFILVVKVTVLFAWWRNRILEADID